MSNQKREELRGKYQDEDGKVCGFDSKKECSDSCKWYETCTRNPINRRRGR